MYIKNEGLRFITAALLAVAKEALEVFPLHINRAREIAKTKIDTNKPFYPYVTQRIKYKNMNSTNLLKDRKVVSLKDLPVKPNGFIEGKYFIEAHYATHFHHDLSIIVNDKVYRVARTPSLLNKKSGYLGLFPGPKEKTSWVLQPEHMINEVPNPPEIVEGYGKGESTVVREGKCFVNMSYNGNLHVIFEGIDGVYVLIEKDNMALVIRKENESSWIGKHVMKDDRDVEKYLNDPEYICSEKLDGAAIEWQIVNKGGKKHLVIHSYRPDAKLEKKYGIRKQIDHTYRVKIADEPLPDNIPEAKGRGELWYPGEGGLTKISSLLNSNLVKARESEITPQLYIHDLIEYEGKNVSDLPYERKLSLMENINGLDKRFNIPTMAWSTEDKQRLWKSGKQKQGIDGIITWKIGSKDRTNTGRAIKLKYKHDQDNWYPATITDIIPQRGDRSEEFGYPVLENQWGTRFQSGGLGLTEEIRRQMRNNPEEWIGKPVRYSAERHFPNHKPFQPVIKEFLE